MKEKVVCGNLYQPADSVRLATPLARFGKVGRTASKQRVGSSSLPGRATSFLFNDLREKRSSAFLTDGRGWRDYGIFPLYFYRSNCLRELNSMPHPLRIRSCHRNVVHAVFIPTVI